MQCDENSASVLKVETDKAIYEIQFGQIQIEITGRCNMRCMHCRASSEPYQDMPIGQIVKIIRFARQFSPNYKEIVISGGEPLLHRRFDEVLTAVRQNGGESVTLTTNGWFFNEKHLNLIEELQFKRFVLSVSLDSVGANEHNSFRKYPGAFERAIKAIKLVVAKNLPHMMSSVRTTLQPRQIDEMESIVDFVHGLGCRRSSFSAIHPAGRAMDRPDLWMTKEQKKKFIAEIFRLKNKYPGFMVTTNDPLKCLMRNSHDVGKEGELVFDGCGAAAITFNVGASGIMTPCSLLPIPMMSIFGMTIAEMTNAYRRNEIVRNILDLNLKGKCGSCPLKFQCGGCRVRPYIRSGDYLGEDPDCWR